MLNAKLPSSYLSNLVILVFLPFTLLSCAVDAPLTRSVSESSQDLVSKNQSMAAMLPSYQDAINDALNPTPEEVVDNLVSISRTNTDLQWRLLGSTEYVNMVTLGSTQYTPGDVVRTEDYMWVTAVPEVQQLCSTAGWGGNDLSMRLRQLLGLTPTDTITTFTEFWVDPADLFRPAGDSAIATTTAQSELPPSASPEHRLWINELRSHQYFQSSTPANNAYPWTQLGYTCDWGQSTASPCEQGASEFVIFTNSDVIVNTSTPIAQYCSTN